MKKELSERIIGRFKSIFCRSLGLSCSQADASNEDEDLFTEWDVVLMLWLWVHSLSDTLLAQY